MKIAKYAKGIYANKYEYAELLNVILTVSANNREFNNGTSQITDDFSSKRKGAYNKAVGLMILDRKFDDLTSLLAGALCFQFELCEN